MNRSRAHKCISILLIAMLLSLALFAVASASPQSPRLKSVRDYIYPVAIPDTDSILYVKPGGSGPSCSSWDEACELQTALGLAGSGDEIWVAQGIYYPGSAGDERTVTFQLKSGVAIYGGFAGGETALAERDWSANLTILSGDIDGDGELSLNAYHVVTGSGVDASALLDGFTITAGNASIEPFNRGGGMYNSSGSPTLINLTFSANHAHTRGGGMSNYNYSSPTLTNVNFSANSTSAHGGGMTNDSYSSPTLTNVTFSANRADHDGGGMFNSLWSSPTLMNVTFTDNSADRNGGGMANEIVSNPTLTNVTFSANIALDSGGGMYNISSAPTLTNAILWGNSPDQIAGVSPAVTYSDIQGESVYPGDGNINDDPRFVDDATGNLRLQPDSPAIDAGDNTAVIEYAITIDLDGSPRFVDIPDVEDTGVGTAPIVDMGAYEAQLGYPIMYVDKAAPGPIHDGASWATAFTNLQAALAAADDTNEIWVASGVYYPGPGRNRYATFQLKSGVELYGGFAGGEGSTAERDWGANLTILSGDIDHDGGLSGNAYHVVTGSGVDATARLDGFTITAGNADSYENDDYPHAVGGGMYNSGGSPTLTNLTFDANSAVYGGGMANDNYSSPTLTSGPTLTNVTFSGNSASEGAGGMWNWNSSPTLTNVTFSYNSAGGGGGMANSECSPALTNVTFYANSADGSGGGIYNMLSNVALTNVLFSGNSANLYGGGMYNWESSPILTNVTFSGNSASHGGGISNTSSSSPLLTNTILWGNSASEGPQIYSDSGSLAIGYSLVQGGCPAGATCDHVADADPQFVDADGPDDIFGTLDDNLRLQLSSPAIDAGDNTADLDGAGPGTTTIADVATDLDGNPRCVNIPGISDTGVGPGAIVDMGTFEVQLKIYLPVIVKN